MSAFPSLPAPSADAPSISSALGISLNAGIPSYPPQQKEVAEQILRHDLALPRPRPKSGHPSKNALGLRTLILDELADSPKLKDPPFASFLANMCSVLHVLGYEAEKVKASSALRVATASQLAADYEKLKGLGLSATIIAKRAHLFTIQDIADIVVRAHAHFGKDGSRSSARAMIDCVLRGRYPSFDALLEAHVAISKEADEKFGSDPKTARVKGAAIGIALRQKSRTIGECYQCYQEALSTGWKIAKEDKNFGPIVRTMAGYVMDGRFESMEDAHRWYTRVHEEVTALFGASRGGAAMVRSASLHIVKGTYKDAKTAHSAWIKIVKEVKSEAKKDSRLKSVRRFLSGIVFSKIQKTPRQAAQCFLDALDLATELFPKNRDGRTLARTVAGLVTQKRYASVQAAFECYTIACKDAERIVPESSGASAVRMSLVMMVLKRECRSVDAAYRLFLKKLPGIQEANPGLEESGKKVGSKVIRAMRTKRE